MNGGFGAGVRRSVFPVVVFLAAMSVSFAAFGAGPSMMPGFPMRAGASIMLMWMPFPGAESYNVYRSEVPGGPYQKIANSPANNFMDTNASSEKSYYYVIKAVVGGKEGDASAEAVLRGVEPMKTPTFVGSLVTPDNKISIRWENNPKAAFYNLYRSETEKGDYKLLASVQDTKYTDAAVKPGKSYYYKVTAVSSSNIESPKAGAGYAVKVVQQAAAEETTVVMVKRAVEEIGSFDVEDKIVLRTPKDVAEDGQGGFFVTDGRGFVMHISKDFKYQGSFPKDQETGEGSGGHAEGICFDVKKKQLYSAIADANQVRVFGDDAKLLRTISLDKPAPDAKTRTDWGPAPVDVAVGVDGVLWVVDGSYFQLVAFNDKGEEIRRIGLPREHKDRKAGDTNLVAPSFLSVNPKNGNLYVLEVAMQRVSVFDKTGKFLFHMGGRGAQPGKFLLPAGIAVDGSGTAFVADRNLERIQSFDEKGNYTATLVNPKKNSPDKQVRIAPGAVGVAAAGGVVFYSDILSEKVVAYKLSP